MGVLSPSPSETKSVHQWAARDYDLLTPWDNLTNLGTIPLLRYWDVSVHTDWPIRKALPLFFDVKDGVGLRCSIDAHDARFHTSWRSSLERFSETDNDERGRSEALNVRFSNAKQDAFEWRCSCSLRQQSDTYLAVPFAQDLWMPRPGSRLIPIEHVEWQTKSQLPELPKNCFETFELWWCGRCHGVAMGGWKNVVVWLGSFR